MTDAVDQFNRLAECEANSQRMWPLMKEICRLVDTGQSDGLQGKCIAALPLFDQYLEFYHETARAGSDDIYQDPRTLWLRMVLESGAEGVDAAEIRRRWLRVLEAEVGSDRRW